MTRTEVLCDVCNDRVRDTQCKVMRPFVGFQFESSSPPYAFRPVGWNDSSRHICKPCLAGLADLHNRMKTIGFDTGPSAT